MTEPKSVRDLHEGYTVRRTTQDAPPFIAVEGSIGAGKTSFCHMLCQVRNDYDGPCDVLLEPVKKPTFRRLMGLFYEDPKRWAFTFQMYALKERFQQHTWVSEMVLHGTAGVQDRSIFADGCFASIAHRLGNMTDDEWEVYAEMFGHIKRFLRYPDIIVFLDVSPEVCLERIKLRARSEEVAIPLDYLRMLDEEHQCLAEEMSRFTRVLRVDWKNLGRDVEDVNQEINEVLLEDRRFLRDFRRL